MRKGKISLLFIYIVALILLTKSLAHAQGLTIGYGATLNVNDGTLYVTDDITNNWSLTVSTGIIIVGGSWANNGVFIPGTGVVNFIDGHSLANITGNSQFYNLSASTLTGKQLNFGAGNTQTVTNAIYLYGISGNLLTLRSSYAGQQALINLLSGGTQAIGYIDVKDHGAIGQHLALGPPSIFNSVDSGNNNRWFQNNAPPEVCDGIDNDGDTVVDEGVTNTYYRDADVDAYGNPAVTTEACTPPPGYVQDNTDCNDDNSYINPGVVEVCNLVDDNCDNVVDEGVQNTYYRDVDSDSYGNISDSIQACTPPTGYVTDDTDCDDNDPATYPGAVETPNDGIDQDCDGFDLAMEVLINGAGIDQQSQTVAWNDVDNEYLVLWQDFRNGAGNPDIYGARLDIDGNVIATDLPVITQTAKQAGPWVSYGGSGYLAVWVDQRTKQTTGTDIYGAWILPDGTVSSEFIVTDAAANQRAASVIYNPSANNFLVTWTDDTNGANDGDVWGALINPGGGVSGSPFAMVTSAGNQRGPYVRYDYGNSQYFMVWFDNRNGANDVYGSRVSASGTLLDGSSLVISNASGNQNNPRITDRRPADGISNFVLSWIDLRNGQADIYGALIDEFGTKLGSDIQIAGGSYDQRAASIDVDYIRTGQAVVSWIDKRNGTDFDIYRAQVDQSGVVSGETLVAGAATGAANNQQGPLVTYSEDAGSDNGFLFLWRDNRGGVDYDLYGIKVWP